MNDYITKKDRSGLVREIKDEQDIIIDNEKIDKPVYATLQYDNDGNLIFEDYTKLDIELDKFIEKYKRLLSKENKIYVRLNDLRKLKLSMLEEIYAFEYLKSKDIKVRGISEDIFHDNYESITTHKSEKKFDEPEIVPWHIQKTWFEKYHEALNEGNNELAKKYINQIYMNNLKLLKFFTNKVMLKYDLPMQDKDDCLSYADIAFLSSISSFELSVGCKFSTYLCTAIRNTVLREWHKDKGLGPHWPEYIKYKRGVEAASEALYDNGFDRKPTYQELEQLFTYTEMLPSSAISRLYEKTSLIGSESLDDESLFSHYVDDKDKIIESDTLSDEELIAPETEELVLDYDLENEADKNSLREALINVLKTLNDQERTVIIKRFGLEDGKPMFLEEIGKELHLSRERIRQIEAKALRKLRHPSRSKMFKDFNVLSDTVIVGHTKL